MRLKSLHRIPATGVTLVCMLLGGLLFANMASAALQYPLVGKIPGGGEEIAVDGVHGSVILGSNSGVEALTFTGEPEWSSGFLSSGIAVNEGTGDVYIASYFGMGTVSVFDSTGASLFTISGEGDGHAVPKGLVEPRAITIDQTTGNAYVYDKGNEAIDVFSPTGEYLFQINSAGGNQLGKFIHGLAVDDTTGELLVGYEAGSGENSLVYVFNAGTGEYVATWSGAGTPQKSLSGALRLAVNNTTGDVYVAAEGLEEHGKLEPAVVNRFSPTGEYDSQIPGPPGEPFPINRLNGVALDQLTGNVYVLTNGVDVFGSNPIPVPHVGLTAPTVKPTSVILHGLVDPQGTGEATCEFEFGTSSAYGQRIACPAHLANGNVAVPVEVQVNGLKSDTTYYYRLDGTNVADGYTNTGEGSEDVGELTTPGPKFVAEGVSAVTAESASFQATIIPNGVPTTAYFEYGTSEAYGMTAPGPPGVVLGAGMSEAEFSRHVQGLQANTVYHYRLVVLSELAPGKIEEVDGPDRTLTTQPPAAGLVSPDGRVWELVTPAEKRGALFFSQNYGVHQFSDSNNPFVGEASASGGAMVDLASASTEVDPAGYVGEVSVLSTRGPGGWSSRVLVPSHAHATAPADVGGEYMFFSEDLSQGIVDPFGPFTALSPDASEATLYLHSNGVGNSGQEGCASSCYTPLVTAANTQNGVEFGKELKPGAGCGLPCGPHFVAATPDASHVVLSSAVQLTSAQNERNGNEPFYYEWNGGQLRPLYMLPETEGGRGVFAGRPSTALHQLSDNGSVFFDYGGHLYLDDFAKDESVRLDIAQGVAEPPAGGASFLYANSDGSRVLFGDPENLTSGATGKREKIYECLIVQTDTAPGCDLSLTDLSSGAFIGGSEDASYLYFKDATEHLLVDHYSKGEWVTIVGPFVGTWPISPTNLAGFPIHVAVSKVSSDGRWLTFMSEEELTGYDNRDAVSDRPDVEVYLYDGVSNRLVCASCNTSGARPVGVEVDQEALTAGSLPLETPAPVPQWEASDLPPWTRSEGYESRYQPRFLSDSGRLFFDSHDALVPQDVDGTQDVYEFEPPGVGDCTTTSSGFSTRTGGCVSLISAGDSIEESAFMDASENGGDVFFITLSKLVSQDFDSALDVYDAHECTTQSPCAAPVAASPPACTTGDACKASPTPQPPVFGAPASATFSGAGNVSPAGTRAVANGQKAKSVSRSQKLSRALRACARKRRSLRAGCVRNAHRRYGKLATHGKRG